MIHFKTKSVRHHSSSKLRISSPTLHTQHEDVNQSAERPERQARQAEGGQHPAQRQDQPDLERPSSWLAAESVESAGSVHHLPRQL